MISGWSFSELQRFISYKAQAQGLTIEFVNPRKSSHTCSHCRSEGRTTRDWFVCTACGLMMDRDLNAARIIAAGGAPVNAPEDASKHRECQAVGFSPQ